MDLSGLKKSDKSQIMSEVAKRRESKRVNLWKVFIILYHTYIKVLPHYNILNIIL